MPHYLKEDDMSMEAEDTSNEIKYRLPACRYFSGKSSSLFWEWRNQIDDRPLYHIRNSFTCAILD